MILPAATRRFGMLPVKLWGVQMQRTGTLARAKTLPNHRFREGTSQPLEYRRPSMVIRTIAGLMFALLSFANLPARAQDRVLLMLD